MNKEQLQHVARLAIAAAALHRTYPLVVQYQRTETRQLGELGISVSHTLAKRRAATAAAQTAREKANLLAQQAGWTDTVDQGDAADVQQRAIAVRNFIKQAVYYLRALDGNNTIPASFVVPPMPTSNADLPGIADAYIQLYNDVTASLLAKRAAMKTDNPPGSRLAAITTAYNTFMHLLNNAEVISPIGDRYSHTYDPFPNYGKPMIAARLNLDDTAYNKLGIGSGQGSFWSNFWPVVAIGALVAGGIAASAVMAPGAAAAPAAAAPAAVTAAPTVTAAAAAVPAAAVAPTVTTSTIVGGAGTAAAVAKPIASAVEGGGASPTPAPTVDTSQATLPAQPVYTWETPIAGAPPTPYPTIPASLVGSVASAIQTGGSIAQPVLSTLTQGAGLVQQAMPIAQALLGSQQVLPDQLAAALAQAQQQAQQQVASGAVTASPANAPTVAAPTIAKALPWLLGGAALLVGMS
jgi:hypothetical protein